LKIEAEPHTVSIKILIDMKARNGDLSSMGERGGAKNLAIQKNHNEKKLYFSTENSNTFERSVPYENF
jgi:hypothetical protein